MIPRDTIALDPAQQQAPQKHISYRKHPHGKNNEPRIEPLALDEYIDNDRHHRKRHRRGDLEKFMKDISFFHPIQSGEREYHDPERDQEQKNKYEPLERKIEMEQYGTVLRDKRTRTQKIRGQARGK